MTNREKFLLQLMICIGVVGVIAVYLVLPQVKKNRILNEEYEEVLLQSENMEMLLAQTGVVDGLDVATETTENTWNFFQKGLSSYEIDSFINDLAIKNNVEISLLSIGSYELTSDKDIGLDIIMVDVSSDSSFDGNAQVEDMLLKKATVLINVDGDYEDVLQFIDDINKRSECIQIRQCVTRKDESMIAVDENDDVIEGFEYLSAQITVDLYSIISYEEWMENAANRTEIQQEVDVVW